MQNIIDHSDRLAGQSNADATILSNIVMDFREQATNVTNWLSAKKQHIQCRPDETILCHSSLAQVVDEFSKHERFIEELSSYCHNVMQLKERGLELRDNDALLSEEERDEIQIQLDSITVHYEGLKIVATDRLRNLRDIINRKQFSKLEQFEEWLTTIEMKIASSSNIGPDFNAIQKQTNDAQLLRAELEQKQDFLNIISDFIIFDHVDPSSLRIQAQSSEDLDRRFESINTRWIEVCRFVDARLDKLNLANSIWKLLQLEGPQLAVWLKQVEHTLHEMSEAIGMISDVQPAFVDRLLKRFIKVDADIKQKESFYTSLESRVRSEIEKFDDPCLMLVIELEKKLEDIQDNWNSMLNKKRKLDYRLQALSNPSSRRNTRESIIPLPDSITPTSDDVSRSLDLIANGLTSDQKIFDNSLSSDSKYGNPHFGANDSPDEISSISMTSSLPVTGLPSIMSNDDLDVTNVNKQTVIPNNSSFEWNMPSHYHQVADHGMSFNCNPDGSHSCRVEEWKFSLESFSNWLKELETHLSIDAFIEIGIIETESYWSQLDLCNQLDMLNQTERQIAETRQDEFDCIILQGKQIIEDLLPGEDQYKVSMEKILTDIDMRYTAIKKRLEERKKQFMNLNRWHELVGRLKESYDQLMDKMGQIIPETSIGLDLITIAQQQDSLMHSKADLEENELIKSSIRDARMFLSLYDHLQRELRAVDPITRENVMQYQGINNNCSQNDPAYSTRSFNSSILLLFRDMKEDIESLLDKLILHYSEFSQLIDERLARLDQVHKEMHSLQHWMQEMASRLQLAEILRSSWIPVDDLPIEKLSEQLEDLKLFRERLADDESVHKSMNSIIDWMIDTQVPISQQNLKRTDELNSIWDLIQVSVEERQKQIEQAFDNQSASEQRFLDVTVADLPRWERRVATSKVPFFVNLDDNKTYWDHPKFTALLESLTPIDSFFYAAYRTALKLRAIQRVSGIDLLMLEQLVDIIETSLNQNSTMTSSNSNQNDSNQTLVGVEQIVLVLKNIYEKIQRVDNPALNVPLSIDLTLNWLLNLYDPTRTGYISGMALRVGLALICCANREEKYNYMYELAAKERFGSVDARRLGTLFEICMRVPVYLGEGESFGGSTIIETNIRNCFTMSKFNPSQPNCIDRNDYTSWLKSEPELMTWLDVLHRILVSEHTKHQVKCKLCHIKPMVGLRYRCMKCLNFNICQNCFLLGRNFTEHPDSDAHQMQENRFVISSKQNVRDFTKIIRNKVYPRPSPKK